MSNNADAEFESTPPPDHEVLEKVLRQSFAAGDEPVDPALAAALFHVVARHDSEEGLSEALVSELVLAVISSYFGVVPEPAGLWSRMATSVAGTLCDDPVARDRLGAWWNGLRRSSHEKH